MTKKFTELGLPDEALRAVTDLGYEAPTPVQEQAIPAILEGRDVIAAAKTGTGKTAAFCLPTISTLPHKRQGAGPTMLILTPTRELAMRSRKWRAPLPSRPTSAWSACWAACPTSRSARRLPAAATCWWPPRPFDRPAEPEGADLG